MGNRRLTDPVLQEEENCDFSNKTSKVKEGDDTSFVTVGYLPSSEQIACLLQEGCVDPDMLISDTDHLKNICSELLPNVTKCLVDSVRKFGDSEQTQTSEIDQSERL